MPYLSPDTQRRRREQIAAAALRCFSEKGAAHTSMADVVRESGLSNGAIYSHFETKADLMRFAFSHALEARYTALVENAVQAGAVTPRDLVVGMLRGRGFGVDQARDLVQIWSEVARDPDLATSSASNLALVRGILTEALAPWSAGLDLPTAESGAVIQQTVELMITTVFGFATRLVLDQMTDVDSLARSLAERFPS